MYKKYLKNLFDILIGATLSILSSPILLIFMLAIRIESKGSPIFKQVRIGKNLKPFTMYKLRSMKSGVGGNYFTSTNDSRITRIGKFIRITSLDELPQLWNVALGDMSLIGPRPDLPIQRDLYTNQQWSLRHNVKPGITGLAQATLRSLGTNKARTSLDLFYVRHVSIYLDTVIALRTLRILIKKGVQN